MALAAGEPAVSRITGVLTHATLNKHEVAYLAACKTTTGFFAHIANEFAKHVDNKTTRAEALALGVAVRAPDPVENVHDMPGVPALAATADEVLAWLRDDRKLKPEVLDVSISALCVCVYVWAAIFIFFFHRKKSLPILSFYAAPIQPPTAGDGRYGWTRAVCVGFPGFDGCWRQEVESKSALQAAASGT